MVPPHTQRTVAPLQQAATDLGDEEGPRACKVYGNREYGNVGMGIREWECGNMGMGMGEWEFGTCIPRYSGEGYAVFGICVLVLKKWQNPVPKALSLFK